MALARVGLLPFRGSGGTPTPPPVAVPVWGFGDEQENYTHAYSKAQAQQAATMLNRIHGQLNATATSLGIGYGAAGGVMRTVNTSLVLGQYVDGTRQGQGKFAPDLTPGGVQLTTSASDYAKSRAAINGVVPGYPNGIPQAAWAREAAGGYVYATSYNGQYNNRPDSAAWQGWFNAYCWQIMQTANADTMFCDDCGTGGKIQSDMTDANGVQYTAASWLAGTSAMITNLRSYLAGKLGLPTSQFVLIANGLQNGSSWTGAKALLQAAGVGMMETWGCTSTTALFANRWLPESGSGHTWKGDVDCIPAIEAVTDNFGNPCTAEVMCDYKYTGNENLTDAQYRQMREMGFASFMLGTSGQGSLFNFNPYATNKGVSNIGYGTAGNQVDPPLANASNGITHVDYGSPTESYVGPIASGSANLYKRLWTKAIFVVNPTANASNAYSLPRTFSDLDGNTGITSIALAAHTAAILLG